MVFPRSCPVCGKVTKDGADICPDCEPKLVKIGSQICYKCGQPVTGAADMWCPFCARTLRGEEFLRYRLPKEGKASAENGGGGAAGGGKEHFFTQARSLYRYNGAMRQSIYRLKYKNAKEYAIYYGKQMAKFVAEGAYNVREAYSAGGTYDAKGFPDVGKRRENAKAVYDAVIPVPMYRKKQKKRGYNQAELLAAEIGYSLGVPVRKNLLLRVRETAPMKELTRSERRKNLKDAFAVRNSGQPLPGSVLLVDDIFTTGATADACAYVLRRSGVHRIDCLCLAMEDLSV